MLFIRLILLLILFVPAARAVTEQRTNQKFKVASGAKLVVDVDSGNVDITHGQDNAIEIEAYRKVQGENETAEKQWIAAVPIELVSQGSTVFVLARRHHQANSTWPKHFSVDARYTIRVPAALMSELRSGGGGISVADVAGSCQADTGGGALTFSRLRGPLLATSGGGNIELNDCQGALALTTAGGTIKAGGGGGALTATTAGGSIVVRNFSGDAHMETSGGAIDLQDVRGKISSQTAGGSISAAVPSATSDVTLETAAGEISVSLPPDAHLDVTASSAEGRVFSELPVVASRSNRDRLEGKMNGGGKTLKLRTGAGNILIKASNPQR